MEDLSQDTCQSSEVCCKSTEGGEGELLPQTAHHDGDLDSFEAGETVWVGGWEAASNRHTKMEGTDDSSYRSMRKVRIRISHSQYQERS